MENRDEFISILPSDLIGGAEYFLKNLSTQLIKDQGLKGNIIFLKKKSNNIWDQLKPDVDIFYGKVTREKWSLPRAAYHLARRSGKQTKYVVTSAVHLNGFTGLLRNIGLLKTQYLIVRESNSIFDRIKGPKKLLINFHHRFGYSQADLIICQTNYMKEQLLAGNPAAKSWNVHVIPNPLPLDELRLKAKAKLDVNWEEFGDYIVAAGRLMHLKGFDYLIKAFAALDNTNLKLVLLGKGEDRESLTALANELGVEKRLIFTGFVKNPMPYFAKAKLCVVSSTMEGFPNVLLQEMAVNDSVVSTLCAGDIDKIPGLITCKTHSAEALKTAMDKALNSKDQEENRKKFNEFLNDRTMEQFVIKMDNAIKQKTIN